MTSIKQLINYQPTNQNHSNDKTTSRLDADQQSKVKQINT